MTTEAKKKAGRPSRWGAGNSDTAAIADDLANINGVTPYYQQKLIEMGLAEITLTEKGRKFLGQ